MPPRRRLGEVLVEAGMIDEFQLRAALSDQKRWGRPLGATLVKLGFVEEEELLRVLSRQLDVPLVDLRGKRIAPEALATLPLEIAEKSHCIPLFKKREGGHDVLYLGMEDPTDLAVLDDLAFRTGLVIRPVLLGPGQLGEALERYYHRFEWEEEKEAAAGFETPVEPGDTAPLVFKPEEPEARTPHTLGPEMLEREETRSPPSQTLRPTDESEFEFAVEIPPAPPEAPGVAFAAEARLGPEFITDVASDPASQRPLAPPLAPKRREVPTRTILRAVTQLLVDKGVITRVELMERVRKLEGSEPGAD